ncbi:MAG: hypothetical protein ACOYXU_01340 [Nitrospirota bacterium]
MTIGEVEEFLWSLSTCLEGRIGDWQLRFGGSLVSVRVNQTADQITISAPTTTITVATPLSRLAVNELQAAFQRVVDQAQGRVRTDRPAP